MALLLAAVLATACGQAPTSAKATPSAAPATGTPTSTASPSVTPSPSITPSPTPVPTQTATSTPAPAVLIGAGDVATCGDEPQYQGDEKTAALIEAVLQQSPGAGVFVVGDVVYGDASRAEFRSCFDPSWGRFKDAIRPALGNHDYMTESAAPYFEYFGAAAGEPGKGYYSYDLGDWHIVVLNSNCNDIACGPNSAQVAWLREDLQANTSLCTLAYWHHPRFSSGIAGDNGIINPFWRAAFDFGVEVVVSGHDHDYERFAPMNVEGQPDPNGPRQFVVGTGGSLLREFGAVKPNSEVRYTGTHGVIQFTLYPDRYEWHFMPTDDLALTDMGEGECH